MNSFAKVDARRNNRTDLIKKFFMKISFYAIGKNHDPELRGAIHDFTNRIQHYFPVAWKLFPQPKISNQQELMKAEAEMLLNVVQSGDYLVALDERGKQMDSPGLASFIEQQSFRSTKQMVFIIGGAFGIHKPLLEKCQFKWSLSQLTFPHQLVRLILVEQVYRACTILRNEKYHHV